MDLPSNCHHDGMDLVESYEEAAGRNASGTAEFQNGVHGASTANNNAREYCALTAATRFVSSALFYSPSPTAQENVCEETSTAMDECASISTTTSYASNVPYQQSAQQPCRCGGEKSQAEAQSMQTTSKESALEQLGSELICAICQQYFVEACTVECGHSFCRMCLEDWLKARLTCPECRNPVQKPPVASLCLDKAVRVMLELTREEEIAKDITERKLMATKARESECYAQNCLETLFQRAVQQGVRIVHISKRWSPREQQRFLCGIERHRGVAREAYCKVVGLTYEWIGGASMDELIIAAMNVQLKDVENKPRPPNEWKERCVTQLRCRLEMYIRYG